MLFIATVSFGPVNFKPGIGLGLTDYVNFGGTAADKVRGQIVVAWPLAKNSMLSPVFSIQFAPQDSQP